MLISIADIDTQVMPSLSINGKTLLNYSDASLIRAPIIRKSR